MPCWIGFREGGVWWRHCIACASNDSNHLFVLLCVNVCGCLSSEDFVSCVNLAHQPNSREMYTSILDVTKSIWALAYREIDYYVILLISSEAGTVVLPVTNQLSTD